MDKNQTVENRIEFIGSNSDEEIDYSELFEELYSFYDKPLSINEAEYDELSKLFLLNEFQIQSIIDYRKKYGDLLSVYELQYIFGFNEKTVKLIEPFITVQKSEKGKNCFIHNFKYGKNEILLRSQRVLQEQKGYVKLHDSVLMAEPRKNRFLGDPNKLLFKYRYTVRNSFSAGIVAEKDAGEEFFSGSNKTGFDFYSFHVWINNNKGILKTIAFGNYKACFGQGLTFSSGLSFGKTAEIEKIKKTFAGIKPGTSANENQFLQGAALTISIKKMNITGFYSNKKIDVNITDTSNNGVICFSSFRETGSHSTPGEISTERVMTERITGGNISYNRNHIRIGITAVNYVFGGELTNKTDPCRIFDFSGSELTNIGFDYQFGWRNRQFFGEISYGNFRYAILYGAVFYVTPEICISALYRDLSPGYYAHYNSPFSENSSSENEKGLYLGTKFRVFSKISITAYMDNYTFPWLKYRVDQPSHGFDYFLQVNYALNDRVEMYARINKENKQKNTSYETVMPKVDLYKKYRIRYNINCSISENLTLKNRIDFLETNTSNSSFSNGFIIIQDVMYNSILYPITVNFRYALFDTDDYDSRIYEYENDVLNSISLPAYYYKGVKYIFLVRYKILPKVTFWFRCSHTVYSNQEIIGSGLNEIKGNKKTEVKTQLRFIF